MWLFGCMCGAVLGGVIVCVCVCVDVCVLVWTKSAEATRKSIHFLFLSFSLSPTKIGALVESGTLIDA